MSNESRGIYIRVSTEDQGANDKASVPSQKQDCVALCERRGYPVYDIYVDDHDYIATQGGQKGRMVAPSSKRRDRPEYLRMIENIRAGKMGGVVCWKWDRLGAGSGIYPLMDAIEELPHITIETVTEGEISPLMLSMLTAFRAQVLRDMKDRVIMGGKARLENGKFWAGNRCYGYDLVDGQRVVNPDEAKWVKQIFEWYTDGVNTKEIRRRLITGKAPQKGHSSTKRPWNEGVIRYILRNSAYIGKVIITWDGQPYEMEYEALISSETFRKAQEIMSKNRTWPDRNKKLFYLLGGMLRCADCGRLWHIKSRRFNYLNGRRYPLKAPHRVYHCPIGTSYPDECPNHKAINAKYLEGAVWGAVSEAIKDPQTLWEQIQERIEELNANREERLKEAGKLREKLASLQDERRWLILQARKGVITQVDFEAQLPLMDAEQAELEFAYQEASQDIPDELETERLKEFVNSLLADYQESLTWLDDPPEGEQQEAMEARRAILEMLVDEVVIEPSTESLHIKGVFDRVVQFNTEWPQSSYLDLSFQLLASYSYCTS